MDVSAFVGYQRAFLRTECNFTPDELLFFELRADGWNLTGVKSQMAERGRAWSESKVADLSAKTNHKIRAVIARFPDVFRDDF